MQTARPDDKLKLKIEQAESAVAHADKLYKEAEPRPSKEALLQLLLAEKTALSDMLKVLVATMEQLRDKESLQHHPAAGVGDNDSSRRG